MNPRLPSVFTGSRSRPRRTRSHQREISPISDVRGSADYKRLLTRQLLIAQLTRLFPDRLAPEDFHRSGS